MNFLIVGTIRNCQKKIFETVKCIDKGLDIANKIAYFFVESDSEDQTLISLQKLSSHKKNFKFESFGQLSINHPLRTERLAICRNRCLEFLNEKKNDWVEYLIVVDTDGVCSELNKNIIKDIISKDYWSVMAANVRNKYYDIYALRHKSWCPNDFTLLIKRDLQLGISYEESYAKNVLPKMININPSSELIEVDSAFGGLAIYRKSSIPRYAKYIGLDENGDEGCEHISFHNSIKNNQGKIFINPKLIIGPKIIQCWIIFIKSKLKKYLLRRKY